MTLSRNYAIIFTTTVHLTERGARSNKSMDAGSTTPGSGSEASVAAAAAAAATHPGGHMTGSACRSWRTPGGGCHTPRGGTAPRRRSDSAARRNLTTRDDAQEYHRSTPARLEKGQNKLGTI